VSLLVTLPDTTTLYGSEGCAVSKELPDVSKTQWLCETALVKDAAASWVAEVQSDTDYELTLTTKDRGAWCWLSGLVG